MDVLVTQKSLWEISVYHKFYLWNWGLNFLPYEIITFSWNLQICHTCGNIQTAMLGSWKNIDTVKILHIQNCHPKILHFWDHKIHTHLAIKLWTVKFSICLNIGFHKDKICTRCWVRTFICHKDPPQFQEGYSGPELKASLPSILNGKSSTLRMESSIPSKLKRNAGGGGGENKIISHLLFCIFALHSESST